MIEILIVVSILSVISLAIYATFNNGIKIWQKVNQDTPAEDADIFFDKFASDLRKTFKFTGIDFLGSEHKLEFPILSKGRGPLKGAVGRVSYSYNGRRGSLDREEMDFAQIYRLENAASAQSLQNVKSLSFQYYIYDRQTGEYIWQDEWVKDGLPLAVRIYLEIDDGDQINGFTRTVYIPVGG